MKSLPNRIAFVVALSMASLATANATPITDSSSELAKVGYSFGYLMGEGNKDTVNDLDLDAFYQGFKDSYGNKKPTLTADQMQKTLLTYGKRREAEYAKQLQTLARKNLEQGEVFLAKNAKKAGVITTKSGLQYQVLTQGTGRSPTATDTVKVHYEGQLLDGTVFDSSIKRGEPVQFPLNQVIKGWREGLPLMKEGAKYRFFVPARLGYGEAGMPGIEPNSVLIFDVNLLEVNPKPVKNEAVPSLKISK